MRRHVLAALVTLSCVALVAVLFLACGRSADAGNRCVPGKQDTCGCPGGVAGTQVCRDDGKVDPCVCAPSGSPAATGSKVSEPPIIEAGTSATDGGMAGKGALAECKTGGNVLVLAGEEGASPKTGYLKITGGKWLPTVNATKREDIRLTVTPSAAARTSRCSSTRMSSGEWTSCHGFAACSHWRSGTAIPTRS